MKFQTGFSVLLAALAAIAPAQDLQKRISFSAPASRAVVLLPQLAKEFGFPLKTIAQTEDEVLLIQVHDVTIRDLLDRIATVANATWKKDQGAYRLVRPDMLNRKAAVKEASDRVVMFQTYLNQLGPDKEPAPAWSPDMAQKLAKALKSNTDDPDRRINAPADYKAETNLLTYARPAAVAVQKLLEQIGAQELADIEGGQRVVFALHPTAMQVPLGGDSARVISEFVTAQREYAEAIAQQNVDIVQVRGSRQYGDAPTPSKGNPSLGIGQAILVLDQRSSRMFVPGISMSASLLVVDPTGTTLAFGTQNIMKRFQEQHIPINPAEDTRIAAGAFARELAPVFSGPMVGNGADEMATMFTRIKGVPESIAFMDKVDASRARTEMSKEVRDYLLQPEINDPLAPIAGDVLSLAASARKLNLIADLPDSSFLQFNQLLQNPTVSVALVFRTYCPRAGIDVTESNGWLELKPSKPQATVANRVNRIALGKLIRSIDSQKALNLDDLAGFAVAQEKVVSPSDIDGRYLVAIGDSIGRKAVGALQSAYALRIYGTLTPSKRAAMESNGPISLSRLTPDQKRWLADDVFNSFVGPSVSPPASPDGHPPRSQETVRDLDGVRSATLPGGTSNILNERTQALPNGIVENGTLSFKVSTVSAFMGTDPDTGLSNFLLPGDIAARIYQKERPDLGTPIFYKTFQRAVRSTILLKFQLASDVTLTRQLESTVVDPNSMAVAFEDLAQETKAKVLDILAEIRKQYAGTTFSHGAGSARRVPPP